MSDSSPAQNRQKISRGFVIGILALLALQITLTLFAFDTRHDVVSGDPILNVDWCSQYYWSHAARAFWKESHRLWGYDPFYMAGYPLDFVFNSSLPVQCFSVLLGFFSTALCIKLFFLITFFISPILFFSALRNFGLDRFPALAGAALALAQFWLAEPCIFGIWGMLSGSFMLVYSIFALSLMFRWLDRDDGRSAIFLCLGSGLALLIHKTSLVLYFIPALIFIALYIKKLNLRKCASLAVIFLFCISINIFWLLPFLRFLPFKIEDPATSYFQNTDALRIIKDLIPAGPYFTIPLCRDIILAFAIFGFITMRGSGKNKNLFAPLLAVLAYLVPLVYFGSLSGLLRNIQPYRYVSVIYFLLIPASAVGMSDAYHKLAERTSIKAAKTAVAIMVIFFLALQLLPNYRLLSVVAPLRASMAPEVRGVFEWIKQNTDRRGRIMLEDNTAWEGKQNLYAGARFPGILPALLPRECVGGPLPNAFIKHHYVDFHDGIFLSKPIQSFSVRDLKTALDLYNIKWVIAWSDQAKNAFRHAPDLARLAASFKYLDVFELLREPDFFLQGSGTVNADYNRIELKDLKPRAGRVTIKYHFVKGLKSRPEARIVQVPAGDDPIGFIGIEDPPASLVITFK